MCEGRAVILGVMIATVVTFFPLIVSAQDNDLNGWDEVKWGMSEEEIVKVYGNKLVKFNKREHYGKVKPNKDYATMGLEPVEIGGRQFKVTFIMDGTSNKLKAVNVKPLEKLGGGSVVLFRSLEEMLVEKYGKPSYQNKEDEPDERLSGGVVLEGSKNYITKWLLPRTIISLKYLEIRPVKLTLVVIQYKKRDSSRTKNL